MLCYNCGEEGHMVSPFPSKSNTIEADVKSRDCVNEKVAGVGGGGGTCYNCGEAGHMVNPFQFLLGSKADDSLESAPSLPSQDPSEESATIVERGDIK